MFGTTRARFLHAYPTAATTGVERLEQEQQAHQGPGLGCSEDYVTLQLMGSTQLYHSRAISPIYHACTRLLN